MFVIPPLCALYHNTLTSRGRSDNCVSRIAHDSHVKCCCIFSCLWIVGW
jgi:hypothetical protein